jgi:hypothetical protein
MARKVPTKAQTEAIAAAQGFMFANAEEPEQARYKVALGLPLSSRFNYDLLVRLIEIMTELDQRIEALENKP